jgi:hypothetical protein
MLSNTLQNLMDPAILFFFLGCVIALLKSNLEIPSPIVRFFSLYLLMAMGFKGGVALSTASVEWSMIGTLAAAMVLAVTIPALAYLYLRHRYSRFDAAAIAAAYGSVSAVTFITATQLLEREGIPFSGHMMVALVLMESPAIVMAVYLAHLARRNVGAEVHTGKETIAILREALTDGAQLLLLGSLAIGAVVGMEGKKIMDPFTGQIFKGILAFFLLEMGLTVVRKGRKLSGSLHGLIVFGIVTPLLSAMIALSLALLLGLGHGDALLLIVLGASASYIVVPAVLREAVPEANPSLYFGAALVVTFPFNILLGLPIYHGLVGWALSLKV